MATTTARIAPTTTAPRTPTSPSAVVMTPAPSARSTSPSSALVRTTRPMTWAPIKRARQGRDESECPVGDRLGPDRSFHQGNGGDVVLASAHGADRRYEPLDRPNHGGLVAGVTIELQGHIGVTGTAPRQPPGQGRGKDAELRSQGGVVVLDNLRERWSRTSDPGRRWIGRPS